jgi:hypothetical protein
MLTYTLYVKMYLLCVICIYVDESAAKLRFTCTDYFILKCLPPSHTHTHTQVQAKWRLPPWKQTLQITTARGAGTGHSTGMERSQGGNLVFLSARPHAYKDYAENGSYRQFKKLYQGM